VLFQAYCFWIADYLPLLPTVVGSAALLKSRSPAEAVLSLLGMRAAGSVLSHALKSSGRMIDASLASSP
jgi:hypothetical protein